MRTRIVVGLVMIVVLSVGVAFIATGCGESDSEKAQDAYDEDVQSLKDAVSELQNPDTYDSLDSLKAAFQDVGSAYDDTVESGQDVADAKISDTQDAYDELKDDINDIDSDQTLSEQIDAVNDAIQNFADQVNNI
jgi:hypothetical protein